MEKKNKIDIEAKLYLRILKLKEEKNKEYTGENCDSHIAYIFNDYNEFKQYFYTNSGYVVGDDLIETCRMKTTRNGSIIALKGLCDYNITKYIDNMEKQDTMILQNKM